MNAPMLVGDEDGEKRNGADKGRLQLRVCRREKSFLLVSASSLCAAFFDRGREKSSSIYNGFCSSLNLEINHGAAELLPLRLPHSHMRICSRGTTTA